MTNSGMPTATTHDILVTTEPSVVTKEPVNSGVRQPGFTFGLAGCGAGVLPQEATSTKEVETPSKSQGWFV